jgi:hypothetical protein
VPGRKRKDELSRARLSILRFHLPNRYLEAGEMNKIDNHVIYSPRLGERVYDQSIFVAEKFNWAKGRELPKSVSVWIDQVCVDETQVFAEKNFPERHLDYKIPGENTSANQ